MEKRQSKSFLRWFLSQTSWPSMIKKSMTAYKTSMNWCDYIRSGNLFLAFVTPVDHNFHPSRSRLLLLCFHLMKRRRFQHLYCTDERWMDVLANYRKILKGRGYSCLVWEGWFSFFPLQCCTHHQQVRENFNSTSNIQWSTPKADFLSRVNNESRQTLGRVRVFFRHICC